MVVGNQAGPTLGDFGYVPGADEQALLRCILNHRPPDSGALALIRRALAERADGGLARLMPLLADHPAADLAADITAELRRRRRQSAVFFLAAEAALESVLDAFGQARITVLLLKGYPLARLYYGDPARRPMADLDLAVRPADFDDAQRVLAGLGYERKPSRRYRPGSGIHAVSFDRPEAIGVDLHRHVLQCSRWNGADDGFWARAQPVQGGGALTLSAADHLLHACVHGYRPCGVLPIRWIVDAATIIRGTAGSLDWEAFVDEAARHRCGRLAAACLAHLEESYGVDLPRDVIPRLRAGGVQDDRYFAFTGHEPGLALTLRLRLEGAWLDWRRYSSRPAADIPGFLTWIAARWGAASPLDFARQLLQRRRPDAGQLLRRPRPDPSR